MGATGADRLDALIAAPDHHRLILENESVRVLDTSIPPGGTTPLHTHARHDMFTTMDGDGRIRIDGMDRVRIMRIRRSEVLPLHPTVTLKGLTLSGARAMILDNSEGPDQLGTGGAIVAEGAGLTLEIEDVTITGNYSQGGGAAMRVWEGAAVTIRNSRLSGNRTDAGSAGGAIMIFGPGQFAPERVTVIGSTISDNFSGIGGGIANWGILTVVGSTLTRNSGVAWTGGILNGDIGHATVIRRTISGNTGGSDEPDHGAGITNQGSLDLQSSTVTLNQQVGPGAGGIARNTMFGDAPLRIINSIVAGNSGGTTTDCLGSPTSLGYNLTTTGGGCSFATTGDITVAGANLFTGVLDQTLKDTGGPTYTHALIPRGTAVDKGSCPGETTDQRGSPRPDNDPGVTNVADGCDIGAYETVSPGEQHCQRHRQRQSG